MRHCTNCGKKRDDNEVFCGDCGFRYEIEDQSPLNESNQDNQQKLEKEEPVNNSSPLSKKEEVNNSPSSNSPNTRGKKKMSKKKKFGLISIFALLALLVLTHLSIKSYLDPEKTVQAMDDDFNKSDAEAFLSHFDYDDELKADAESFYTFMLENGWAGTQGISEMTHTTVEDLKEGKSVAPIRAGHETYIIKVIQKPFLGGLYNKTSFELIPTTLYAQIDLGSDNISNDFEVTYKNDGKVIRSNNKEPALLGKFLPGQYDWDINIKNDFESFDFKEKMKVFPEDDDNNQHIEINHGIDILEIDSNYSDAIVWINNKSTKKTVEELSTIGPVKLDGSMTIQAKTTVAKKKYQTKNIKVTSSYINLDFDIDVNSSIAEEIEDDADDRANKFEIGALYDNYRTAHEDTLNNNSNTYVQSYIASNQIEKDFSTLAKSDPLLKEKNHTNDIISLTRNSDDDYTLLANEQYTFYFETYRIEEWKLEREYEIKRVDGEFKITKVTIDRDSRQKQITRTAKEAKALINKEKEKSYEDFFYQPDYYDYTDYIYNDYEKVSD